MYLVMITIVIIIVIKLRMILTLINKDSYKQHDV